MRAKRYKDSYSMVGRSYSRWELTDGTYVSGKLFTGLGIVSMYSQGWKNGVKKHTRLEFCYGGRHYNQTIDGHFSRRGLSILAGKFIRSMVPS